LQTEAAANIIFCLSLLAASLVDVCGSLARA
jgi:hypothetical protein